jgi:hypothetical protein
MVLCTKTLAITTILLVVANIAVVVGITLSNQQDADARGCNRSVAFNASQGRCFGHGPSTAEEVEAEETDEEEETDDE